MSSHKKSLGWFALFALASGTMISSGIFILPGLAYSQVGPLVAVAYLLASVVALVASLSLIELATAMPMAGGDYFYITRSMGPGLGTVMGLMSWLALMLKTAFAIFGLSEVIHVFSGWPVWIISLGLTLVFLLLNLWGTGEAVLLEILLVVGLLAIMVAFILWGVWDWKPEHFTLERLESNDFFDFGRQIISTSAFVFVSFGGLLNISTMAEEVKDPGRTIPKALLGSVIAIGILYVLMVGVTTALLPPQDFDGSLTPIAQAAENFAGNLGLYAIFLASSLAFATTGNAGMMASSRYPLAMARDGLLPAVLGKVTAKKAVPIPALLVTAVGIGIAVLFPLETLVKLASTVILMTYIAINAAVIILRESGVRNYRPLYKIPGYPYVPVISLVLMSLFLAEMGIGSMGILILFAGAGILFFLLYGRKKAKYEYAALHLLRNVVNSRLQDASLETELRDIIRSRDELTTDLVDEMLQKAHVLDIDHRETIHGVFQMVGSRLAKSTGMTSQDLTERLEERERQVSTALSDFVSIPHVLIEGMEDTQMVLVRDKGGMFFDEEHPSVKAMFIIIGSAAKRELHLKILAGLAHIIQHEDFEKLWLEKKTMDDLVDALVFLDRRRV